MSKSQQVIIVEDIYPRTKILPDEDGNIWLWVRNPFDGRWWRVKKIRENVNKSDSSKQSKSE